MTKSGFFTVALETVLFCTKLSTAIVCCAAGRTQPARGLLVNGRLFHGAGWTFPRRSAVALAAINRLAMIWRVRLTGGTMVISKIKKLAAAREKLAHLELVVENELRQELSLLHKHFGFSDVKSFLKAVRAAAGGGRRKAGRPKKAATVLKTRKRAVITAAMRAKVVKLVKAGMPGSKIATKVGISLPSVQNIKKAAGLVQARASKAKKISAKKPTAKRRRPTRKAPAKKTAAAPQAAPAAPKTE